MSGERTTLAAAITLYLAPDVDREQVGRLIKAMCSLNGVAVAIEFHPAANAKDAGAPSVPGERPGNPDAPTEDRT